MKAIALSLLLVACAGRGFAQDRVEPVAPAPAAASTPVVNPTPAAQPAPARPTSDGITYVVPAETTIPLILQNTINTKSAYAGQNIYCESIFPITVGNRIIIPKGSSVRGTVTQVLRPGRLKGKALLGLRFDELVLPTGATLQLRAVLSGFGTTGNDRFNPKEGKIQGAGSKGADAGKVAETTITGAELGTIIGAGKGDTLKGLGIGTAAGAAAGAIWVLASRGKDIILPYGTSLELKLTQPVTFMNYDLEPASRYDSGPSIPSPEYRPRRR